MIEFSKQRFKNVDRRCLPLLETLVLLRWSTLDEFGELLMSLPNEDFPHLTTVLPSMASEEVQKQWTGGSGIPLLKLSISFMNFVATSFCTATGRPFKNVDVLDFGCGWGRLLRLLAYFNDPEYSYGCDAWSVSLNHSMSCGVEKIISSLKKSDSIPSCLPFDDNKFDLIYAFSIFTHLSENTAKACMSAMHKAVKPNGLAIITIRPLEFWNFTTKIPEIERGRLMEIHSNKLVAFYPADGQAKNAQGHEVIYGDTSIPPEILENLFQGWKIINLGATFVDLQQIFIVLKPLK